MKSHSKYVCQSCAYESPRWVGKCPNCGEWNTFAEEVVSKTASRRKQEGQGAQPLRLKEIQAENNRRIASSIGEFDRVLGGGLVPGSVVLLGGDPGIGKSTLMMQFASALENQSVLYVSGEESPAQVKLRTERLNLRSSDTVYLLAETDMSVIVVAVERTQPDLVIVDSIQTMYKPDLESSPGSVGQVRESTATFMRLAKRKGVSVLLVGHVTKEGMLAGPKVVEHTVDTVLQFEGERHYAFRILRAVKNRFGSTNEIGIFEMRSTGLQEVKNPSEVFLSERSSGSSGSVVVASIEGTRPILVEVQALVTPTSYGVPQRTTTGIDYRRLNLLLAVLEKRVGVSLGQRDVFVNVAGGVHVDEPAVDLGITLAIMSSLRDTPIDAQTVAVGEVGLAGEVRSVSQIEQRIREADKLGFRRIFVPGTNLKVTTTNGGITIVPVDKIDEAVRLIGG